MAVFVKRRDPPVPGSIPDRLQMFRAEVRFYREIAPVAGVRVPACHRAEDGPGGTRLVLEDLSNWRPGADPRVVAGELSALHARFEETAGDRWPWLRTADAAADLVGQLFDRIWPRLAARSDLTRPLRVLGDRLHGRVADAARDLAHAGPLTLVHGDASLANMRTGPCGEVAFLDWEDVGLAPGIADLGWLLVSSVSSGDWDAVTAAYGTGPGLRSVLPAAVTQGLLSLADTPEQSADAVDWIDRLEAARQRLA